MRGNVCAIQVQHSCRWLAGSTRLCAAAVVQDSKKMIVQLNIDVSRYFWKGRDWCKVLLVNELNALGVRLNKR